MAPNVGTTTEVVATLVFGNPRFGAGFSLLGSGFLGSGFLGSSFGVSGLLGSSAGFSGSFLTM